jgi:hypothetical protein
VSLFVSEDAVATCPLAPQNRDVELMQSAKNVSKARWHEAREDDRLHTLSGKDRSELYLTMRMAL